jgi:zona occludens toxin (predicted ATPase)
MPTAILSVLGNKYVLGTLLLGIVLGVGFLAGYNHEHSKLVSVEARYKQAQIDAEKREQDLIAANALQTKRIQDEATKQIANERAAVADLSVRVTDAHTALSLCTTTSSTGTDVQPIGQGTTGNAVPPNQAAPATPSIGINAAVLKDTLDIGIAEIEAELLWREYARSTGQAK